MSFARERKGQKKKTLAGREEVEYCKWVMAVWVEKIPGEMEDAERARVERERKDRMRR